MLRRRFKQWKRNRKNPPTFHDPADGYDSDEASSAVKIRTRSSHQQHRHHQHQQRSRRKRRCKLDCFKSAATSGDQQQQQHQQSIHLHHHFHHHHHHYHIQTANNLTGVPAGDASAQQHAITGAPPGGGKATSGGGGGDRLLKVGVEIDLHERPSAGVVGMTVIPATTRLMITDGGDSTAMDYSGMKKSIQ